MSSPRAGPRGVLLVHGAWFTARAWDPVAERLRQLGVPVAVAQLHRGSLAGDTAAAQRALDTIAEFGPVIACGHSYGGTVITGLDPQLVSHLVYLAAIMPDADEDSLTLLAGAPSELGASMVPGPDGSTTIDPDAAAGLFFSHLDGAQQAARSAGLVPQLMAPGHERPARAAWRAVPSTYVVCTDDRVLNPALQRRLARRASRTLAWDSDHGAFASHESETVQLLSELAHERS